MKKRLFSMLLALVMLLSLCPAEVLAQPVLPQGALLSGQSGIHTNPLYPDAVPSGELSVPDGEFSPAATDGAAFGTLQEMAEDIRDHMKNRTEHFTVYMHYVPRNEDQAVDEITAASE